MTGPIKQLARKLDLKKQASRVPTGLLKLGDVHSAVIFLSGSDVDTGSLVKDLRKFFLELGVTLNIYALNLEKKQLIGEGVVDAVFIHRRHINFYGRIRRNKRTPVIMRECDMFISLLPEPLYLVEREALCSEAMVKVGRHSPDVYNIVVEDAPGMPQSQREAFDNIFDLLKKIV